MEFIVRPAKKWTFFIVYRDTIEPLWTNFPFSFYWLLDGIFCLDLQNRPSSGFDNYDKIPICDHLCVCMTYMGKYQSVIPFLSSDFPNNFS